MKIYLLIHCGSAILYYLVTLFFNLRMLKQEPLKRLYDFIASATKFYPLRYTPYMIVSDLEPREIYYYGGTQPLHPPFATEDIFFDIRRLIWGIIWGPLSLILLFLELNNYLRIKSQVGISNSDILLERWLERVNTEYFSVENILSHEATKHAFALKELDIFKSWDISKSQMLFLQYNLRFFELIHLLHFYEDDDNLSYNLLIYNKGYCLLEEKFINFLYRHLMKHK